MPINQSLPAVLRRRAQKITKDGLYIDEPNFCVALLTAADELEVRQRCATDDEQVAIEAIANNRRLRNNFEQLIQLIADLPLPLKTKLAFQERVDQILGSQRAAGEGRGILAVALPEGESRERIEARVRELLDNHWASVDAQLAAGKTVETPAGLLVDTELVEPMPPVEADAKPMSVAEARNFAPIAPLSAHTEGGALAPTTAQGDGKDRSTTRTQVWLPPTVDPKDFATAYVARFPGGAATRIPLADPQAHPANIADGSHYFEVDLPTWALNELPAFLSGFAEAHGYAIEKHEHTFGGLDA